MKFRWWMAPVIGVGICATANGLLIATSLRVRPQKVEERPYAASAFEDQRAAEREAFAARGWSITQVVDGGGCTLTLTCGQGAGPVAGIVNLYRPDDIASDRELVWSDLTQPLRCVLLRPGVWSVRVVLRDKAGAVLAHDLRLNRL